MPGRAVTVKTEYQRSYRPELFVCSTTTYRNNQTFRRDLKNRFQGHSHDPFIWQDDEDSSDEDTNELQSDEESECGIRMIDYAGVDRRRPAFVADHQFKHEMWNRLYDKKQRIRFSQKASQTNGDLAMHSDGSQDSDVDSVDDGSNAESSVVHVVNGSLMLVI